MGFFRRTELNLRCICRGTALAAPTRDELLDACDAGRRRALQQNFAKYTADDPVWTVQWLKAAGEWLRPNDVVARLRADEVVVELVYAQRAKIAEMLVLPGVRVANSATLARLERRASKAAGQPQTRLLEAVSQFATRQRQDAEMIAALQHDLTGHQQLVTRLREQIAALQSQPGPPRGQDGDQTRRDIADPKFRRLKHEFSKRYHPDARAVSDAERALRTRVFQEFWPIVEEIDRS